MTSILPPRLRLDRRTVLASGTAGAALTTVSGVVGLPGAEAAARGRRYFAHGVASGDPRPDRVVLWTRVTPTANARPGSGKGPRVEVEWEVAKDAAFRRVVRRGTFSTGPGRDHTVKLDVTGLRPATWYHYRFTYRGARSRVGRTRTAPADNAMPRNLRLGVVSCANWQAGWFAAYRGLAQRNDLHAVLHLGDYIYEYGPGKYGYGLLNTDIRKHDPKREMVSLSDYRRRHAQYKTDPDLQDAHAKFPWIVTWDDHEVTNDQWRKGAENHEGKEGNFLRRRARAHRAYDEWMPVRLDGTAELGDGTRLFRRLRFGRLAEISMLDLRTYRDKNATLVTAGEASNPDRTILGAAQLRWLKQSLSRKTAAWKVIGNPVMIAPVTFATLPQDLIKPVADVTGLLPVDGMPYNVDQWDGFTADRLEIYRHIRDNGIKNALFVTGDIHSAWASELPFDKGSYPLSDPVGVEMVCSSVTSNNLKDIVGTPRRTLSVLVENLLRAANPHIKYLNFDDHGFSILDLTPRRAQMDWYVIGDRADRRTKIRWDRSFVTRAGTNRLRQVSTPVGVSGV